MRLKSILLFILSAPALAATPQSADTIESARLAIRTKQFDTAVKLLQTGANRDSADAAYLLGLAQWNGIGTTEDRSAAGVSLRKAAEHGLPQAQFALAALLAERQSGRTEAAQWLARAASAGYTPAVTLRDAHSLPLADARQTPGLAADLRFDIAKFAAAHDDAAMLTASGIADVVSRKDDFGRTLLFDAAGVGADSVMQALLKAGANAGVADNFGETPLMIAAAQPQAAVLRLLLAAGARVDDADRVGRTALFRAAAANQAGQIELLLKAGAAVDHADTQGWTAFDLAAQRAAAAAVARLQLAGGHAAIVGAGVPRVAEGIDPTRAGLLYQGWPPLLIAVARDDATDVRRRLAAGAEVESLTPQGASALQVAIESRARDAMRILLESGADPRRRPRDGVSALERIVGTGDTDLLATVPDSKFPSGVSGDAATLLAIAASRGDVGMARALLTRGIGAEAADKTGMTALMLAARAGDTEMIKLLLDRGGAPATLDARGRSALWYAAAARSLPSVEVLLAVHAVPDGADREGVTPLLVAIRAGSEPVVARLLAAGAAVVPAESGGKLPLRTAAELGQANIVEQLLVKKADVDASDQYGDTALMAAARTGNTAICVKLLSAGANPRLRNRARATAADVAEARGFPALAQRLRG